jgi:ABC-type multidrug transport system ATPase subunit
MFTEIKVYKEIFIAYFLNAFFGHIKRFTCEFILWGENIVTRLKKDFLYIPRKESIPGDIRVKSFLNLFKRLLKPTEEDFRKLTSGLDKKLLKKTFADIEGTDKALLLLIVAQMKKSPVLIIDNIAQGIPEEGLNKIKEIVQYLRYYDDITIFNFSNDMSFLVADPDSWQSLRYENGKYFDLNRK